jgi:hypothetical protein
MGLVKIRDFPNFPAKVTLSKRFRIRLPVLIAVCTFLFGCETAKRPLAEAQPSPTASPQDQPLQMAKLPPPELSSVQEAVRRVFREAALIDTSRSPVFIAGDFNGDLSQDIAVVLKPAADKLSDLNEEFPTWILRDLSGANQTGTPRLRVAANDALLAIIHGYGANGWRDPQATQTFLLKNAVGSGMEAHQSKDVATISQGKERPELRGDVIGEVLGRSSGYLYYSGAAYSWYDPKTFKGDPAPGMFHGASDRKVKK